MNEVDEIKERINIADLIGGYLTMQKAGSNFKARCPFHEEKTASFMISPEKQIYKCFGCGEGGDIFEFVMKMEGLNFPEALQMLADRAGVMIQKSTKSKEQYKKEKDVKSLIFKINKISSKIFRKILASSKQADKARKYLKKRKLSQEILEKFEVGYAPKNNIVRKYFANKNVGEQTLNMAGSPERFYDRIIFPIFDVLGNPIAFTGRTLSDDVQPKYLNTPETGIFKKGKIVYGLNLAKDSIKKKKYSIVVEGQMDVVLSHMSGVDNAVATSGTAITVDHMKILSRYSDNIAFCFDNDVAGFEASKKAIKISYSSQVNPFVIAIPSKYKDVGEIVENDSKIWAKIAQEKKPALEWLFDVMFQKLGKDSQTVEKKALAKELISYIVLIEDPIEKNHYTKMLSTKFSVPERIISETIVKFEQKIKKTNREEKKDKKKNKANIEELMIGLMIYDTRLIELFIKNIKKSDLTEYKNLIMFYNTVSKCYTDTENKDSKKPDKLIKCIQETIETDLKEKVKFLGIETQERVNKFTETDIKNEFLDYITYIKSAKNKDVKKEYAKRISEAEGKKDIGKLKKLLNDFQKEISNS